MSDLPLYAWKKSSYSSNAAACVEVALTTEVVGVRDTKDRHGGTLVFDRDDWSAFLASLKR